MNDHDKIELFLHNAAGAAADTRRVGDLEEMKGALEEILGNQGAVYCPCETEKERAVIIPEDRRVDDFFNATICVEEVYGAIAETGSLICSTKHGRSVQAGLLPSHHVAIVSAKNIFANLEDFFQTCGDSPPTNIAFITGPSRTADIELTLTIGVHGPERLSVIVC